MRRAVWGVVACIIIVGLVATHFGRSGEPIYAVNSVVSGLQRQPTVWAGRTILVRGAIIWYDAEYRDSQQQSFGGDGCTDDRYPTVFACQRSLAWNLAHLQPGSIVRLVIAPQARLFPYKATSVDDFVFQDPSVEEMVAQNPPGTMVELFHVPRGGITADGLFPRLLRQIPLVASLVPAWPGNAIPTQGIYHLRISAHPAHDGQHDQNDGTLQLP
jgi:hypothetical protein